MTRQKKEGKARRLTAKATYIKSASLRKSQGRSAKARLPDFHSPAQLAREESPRRRTIGKRAAGTWHLGR